MNKKYLILILLSAFLSQLTAYSQQVGIKTNILYWATTTPNIGVETALSPKITLSLNGAYNPWKYGSAADNKKLQHWSVKPELRYWVSEKFEGHFVGFQSSFMSYNAGGVKLPVYPFKKIKNARFEGYGLTAGVSYGYQWIIAPNWNLELATGVGYMYFNYKEFECGTCGAFTGKKSKHLVGPTHLGLSFIYIFKSKRP